MRRLGLLGCLAASRDCCARLLRQVGVAVGLMWYLLLSSFSSAYHTTASFFDLCVFSLLFAIVRRLTTCIVWRNCLAISLAALGSEDCVGFAIRFVSCLSVLCVSVVSRARMSFTVCFRSRFGVGLAGAG
ncbi:hypothetical protein BC567DRAFT_76537 [Phyllosticta citribraziliensis]